MTPLRVLPAAHGSRKSREQLFSPFPALPTLGSTLQPPIPAHANPECIPQGTQGELQHKNCVSSLLEELGSPWFQGDAAEPAVQDEASCSLGSLWGPCMAAFLGCIFQQWQSNPLPFFPT